MIPVANVVDEQPGSSTVVEEQNIPVPIVVHISKGRAPADFGQPEDGSALLGDFFKASISKVAKELIGLLQGIRVALSYQGFDGSHLAVGCKQIQPAIVIVVEESRTKGRIRGDWM